MIKRGELYCTGCGIKLQHEHKDLPGYIPKTALDTTPLPFCKRCHDLRYHNTLIEIEDMTSENDEIIDLITKGNGLIVFVIDILNFKKSLRHLIESKLSKKDVLLVINKFDCLPKAVKENKVKQWVRNRFKNPDFIEDIIITSAKKNYNIDLLLNLIETKRRKRDVYFVGETNAGKSSLINCFLKIFENQSENLITTSFYPNTTLKIIEIPLDQRTYLFDTPGLFDAHSFYAFAEVKILGKIIAKKEIKPKVYQIKDPTTFYFSNFLRIDMTPSSKSSLVVYCSEFISTYRGKLQNDGVKFTNLLENKQMSPISKKIKSLDDLHKIELMTPQSEKVDLFIYGFGFMTIRNYPNQKLVVYLPINVKCELVETLI